MKTLFITTKSISYSESCSLGLNLYSKNEGTGYDLPFGLLAEGSDTRFSERGCFEFIGTVGLLANRKAVLVFSFPETDDNFDID